MIERIVENWLTNVNEKSFQVPFCQMLIGEGYHVVHLSRHGSFEEGKDILAIAPDGTPCAYQLKGVDGRKITQKEWAKHHDQVNRLIETPIKHPSIDESLKRRVFFVANGELDEEVRVEITNQNPDRKRRLLPELETILLGELITRFSAIFTDLWPGKLASEKELLELYLADGRGYLDKLKYGKFVESLIHSVEDPTKAQGQRLLASTALFAAYALFPFMKTDNHIAIIEGWMIFLSYAIAFVEKYDFEERYWKDTVGIVEESIEIALGNLWEEVSSLEFLVAGNPIADPPFYAGRTTWIISYVSVFVLWLKEQGSNMIDTDALFNYIYSHLNSLYLWGETAVPQYLAMLWALWLLDYKELSDQLLHTTFKVVLDHSTSKLGFPDPYFGLGKIVLAKMGLSEDLKDISFAGRSYSLDSLIQLIANRGYRGVLAENWKKITSIQMSEFEPDSSWQYCKWHCEDGILHETLPKAPQSWKELVELSQEINLEKVPAYFVSKPNLLLLFLLVYPHRIRPDVVKFLDIHFTSKNTE